MRGLFNLNGPFYKYGNLIADICLLGLMWIIFSIPIVTIGSSTTAVYYVMTKRISDKENSLIKDFWASFKRNFKTATLAHLTILVAVASVLFAIMGFIPEQMIFIYYFLFAESVLVAIFIYPILSRFDMKYAQLIKTAFIMANKHILTSFLCVVLLLLMAVISFFTNGLFLIFAPGVYFYFSSRLLMRRFKKYRPEMDADENDDMPEITL